LSMQVNSTYYREKKSSFFLGNKPLTLPIWFY
jgi:hypothetical protein